MNSNIKQGCSKLENECNDNEFFIVIKGKVVYNDDVFEKTERGWELSKNESIDSMLLKIPGINNLYNSYKSENEGKFLLSNKLKLLQIFSILLLFKISEIKFPNFQMKMMVSKRLHILILIILKLNIIAIV